MGVATIDGPAIALSAGVLKTLVAVKADIVDVRALSFSISFNGVTASNVPVLVQAIYATDGTGTTLVPQGHPNSYVPRNTCKHTYTVEPTSKAIVKSWYVTPNGGLLVIHFDREKLPGLNLADTDDIFGIQANAPDAVSACASITFEE